MTPEPSLAFDPITTVLLVVAQFALALVSAALNKPDVEDAKPAGLGDFQVPTAVETRAVPVLWGTRDIKGPNVIWHGDLRIVEIEESVGGFFGLFDTEVTVGFRYFLALDLLLCYGEIDRLLRLEISDREAWSGLLDSFGDSPTILSISKPQLLGGEKQGGGVVGSFEVFAGRPNQDKSPYLISSPSVGGGDPELVPAYVDIAHVVARQIEIGESPRLGNYVFRAGRFPNQLGLDPGNHIINESANSADANIAEAIYEVLTSPSIGLGLDPGLIDTQSFIDAGNTLAAEGLGVSLLTTRVQKASDLIQLLLDVADGLLFEDRDGKFRMRLLRDDFGPVDSLFLLDESNVISVEKFNRSSWSETFNHVNVKFTDREQDNIETGAMAQDLANFRTTQEEARIEKAMPAIGTSEVARIVAERQLRQLSFPLANVKLVANREAQALRPGDTVRFSWARFGIIDMVLRVLAVETGKLMDGKLVLTCTQDVFGFPETIFSSPQATGWSPVDTAAIPAVDEIAFQAPYWLLLDSNLDPQEGERVVSAVARPNAVTSGFDLFLRRVGLDTNFRFRAVSTGMTPTARLEAELDRMTAYAGVSVGLDTGTDMERVTGDPEIPAAALTQGDYLALVGDEIIAFRSVLDDGDGTFTVTDVSRGLLDTVPATHAAGTPVYFFRRGAAASSDAVAAGTTLEVKNRTRTSQGRLDLASAATLSLDPVEDRLGRPLPMMNVAVGVDGAETETEPDVGGGPFSVLASYPPERTSSTFILHADAAPLPATGDLEAIVRVRRGDNNALLMEETATGAVDMVFDRGGNVLERSTATPAVATIPAFLDHLVAELVQHDTATGEESLFPIQRDITLTPGFQTRSLEFSGAGDVVRNLTNQSYGIGNSWTLAAWVKPDTAGGFVFDLVDGSGVANNDRIAAEYSTSGVRVRLWDSSATLFKDYQDAGSFSSGSWAHIVVTWSGSSLLIYVNGSDVTGSATLTVDNAGSQSDNANREGNVGSAFNLLTGHDGPIAQVALWSSVLTAAEIADIYAGGDPRFLSLSVDFGNYTSSADLEHWWAVGRRKGTFIAQDVGGGGILLSPTGVTDADLVLDAPGV